MIQNEIAKSLAKALKERDDLAFILAEHERLHKEINEILNPDSTAPKAPSLCDLVSYLRSDIECLKAQNYLFKNALFDLVNKGKIFFDSDYYPIIKLLNKSAKQCVEQIKEEK